MIPHLQDRAAALMRHGWPRREAEWLALVCLHSGVFLRSQHLAFIGRTNPALANRFVRRCRKYAVEQPWDGARLRLCRIAARRIYRVLGTEHVRHRRPAAPEVVLRRLLSLDYLLEHPHAAWLPTEDERVNALTGAGIAKEILPRRLYQGAVGTQYRYFPPRAAARARRRAGDVSVCPGGRRDRERGSHLGLAACRAVGGAGRGRPRRRGGRRGPGRGAPGGRRAGARPMGLDASGVRDDGPRGGGGGDGHNPHGDRDERLGCPGGVRRPEPSVPACVRPQCRVRRKPPVEGRDHEWPDVALNAGAGLTPAGRDADEVVPERGTTPAAKTGERRAGGGARPLTLRASPASST